jgi:adenylate cyclase
MPPNEVLRLLGEYQAHLVPAIQRHGGAIDKYLGDGILATFGAARPSDTYAADALRAVEDVLEQGERWSASLAARGLPSVRIGAAAAEGALLFGVIGHESRLEFTVIGDVVNLAAKLEKYTKSAGVRALATTALLERAARQGYRPTRPVLALPAEQVPGVAQPVDLVGFD